MQQVQEFLVVSTVRSPHTLLRRRQVGMTTRRVMWIMGNSARIAPNIPYRTTHSKIRNHLSELAEYKDRGLIKITTLVGKEVPLTFFLHEIEAPSEEEALDVMPVVATHVEDSLPEIGQLAEPEATPQLAAPVEPTEEERASAFDTAHTAQTSRRKKKRGNRP